MKAIIQKYTDARGEQIALLGIGQSEGEARVAAFAFLNGGHNRFEQETAKGECVEMSEHLEKIWIDAGKWDDVYDESGGIVESERVDPHTLDLALGSLYLVGDVLHTRASK